jgi:acetyl esterase
MRSYPESLAEILRNDKTFINMYGVKIHTKPIPDDPRPGVMDPREYQMALARADAFTKMALENKEGSPQAPQGNPIEAMRRMMGFPNYNMNTIEIYTKYEEHNFDGNIVKLWIYYPRRPEGKTGRPGFIYIHGGGWVGGTPFAVENPCRLLVERADCVVINVDYSLAPEKPFPNAFNDCFNTLKYIYENAEKYGIDKNKIGMGGDSAGGNLTAAVAVKDRDLGTNMLKYQVLLYPAVTFVDHGIEGYEWKLSDYEMDPSQRELIEPNLRLGRPREESDDSTGMAGLYLQNNEDPKDTRISPIFADKKGLCKALIAVAEFDGLRIQGEVYGKMLTEAGVDTRIIRYKGVGHAFLDKLGVLPQAEDVIQEIADDLISL